MANVKLKYVLFFLILALFIQQPSSVASLPEINPRLLKQFWDAVWISYPGGNRKAYGVYHFRKTFRLDEKPSGFVIHVSADNRYKLYVNGHEVADGPARGDLEHWRFETVDIAPYLNRGNNIIASVVWNYGEYVPWAQMTYETAFVVQGNSDIEAVVNTDRTWKVLENESYAPIPQLHPDWPVGAGWKQYSNEWIELSGFVVTGPGDRIDGKLYPWGWERVEYDDRNWKTPVHVARAAVRGIRKGESHWRLVPRMIPPLEKKLQRMVAIRRILGAEVDEKFLSGKKTLLIPARSKVSLLLDQTYLTTAYPEIILSGGKGSRIRLTYAESLFRGPGDKGHRDQIEGKYLLGQTDEFLADGGDNRFFTTLWFRTFRFIELEVETAGQPLIINSFQSRFGAYPYREEAVFESDDPSLKKIWDTAWRTVRLCSGETFFDCPYYEQLQYAEDSRVQALITLYVSGDDRLMRKAIKQFDDSRIPEGLVSSRYPSHVPLMIPTASLFWVAMLHDYWMHRGDEQFVRSFLPGVRSVIGWYERHLTDRGLLGNMPWWNFVDWVEEYDYGVPPGAEEGETAVITLEFLYALRYAEQLARVLGKPGDAQEYRRLIDRVSNAVKTHCWSDSRHMFAETPEKKIFSQHSNIMAILTDLIPAEEQPELFDKIVSVPDLLQCTYYYRFYLTRALKKSGNGERFLEMLEPWYDMLEQGLTTFAETPVSPRSDCHAWSASPIYDLLATVCGVEPIEPGFRRVRIEPHLGRLQWIKASMPHPAGKIHCHLKRLGEVGIIGEIELPAAITGVFIWEGQEVELHAGKQKIEFK